MRETRTKQSSVMLLLIQQQFPGGYLFLKDSDDNIYLHVQFLILNLADLEDKAYLVYDMSDTLPLPPPSVRLNLSRKLIMIDDGGDAHWSATLDLGKEEIIWVMVN